MSDSRSSSLGVPVKGKIGKQIQLPLSKAVEISLKSLRIRFWRSMLTVSSVILAIAFLTFVWTSSRVQSSVAVSMRPDAERAAKLLAAVDEYWLPMDSQLNELFRTDWAKAYVPARQSLLEGNTGPLKTLIFDAGQFDKTPEVRTQMWEKMQEVERLKKAEEEKEKKKKKEEERKKKAAEKKKKESEKPPADAAAKHLADDAKAGDKKEEKKEEDKKEEKKEIPKLGKEDKIVLFNNVTVPSGVVDDLAARARELGLNPDIRFDAGPDSKKVWKVESLRLAGVKAAVQREVDRFNKLNLSLQAMGLDPAAPESELQSMGWDTIWLIAISLLVCGVGIINAMLMSVTERFREIGTMKCLGALDSFIVKLFLLESTFQGIAGTIFGIVIGLLVMVMAGLMRFGTASFTYFPLLDAALIVLWTLLIGAGLSIAAAVFPALRAAHMAPVEAMRVEE